MTNVQFISLLSTATGSFVLVILAWLQANQRLGDLRADTSRQFADMRADTNKQFADMRADTNKQFAAAREYTDMQFAAIRADTNKQFVAAREYTDLQFAEVNRQFADANRQFGEVRVAVAALSSDYQRSTAWSRSSRGESTSYRSEATN